MHPSSAIALRSTVSLFWFRAVQSVFTKSLGQGYKKGTVTCFQFQYINTPGSYIQKTRFVFFISNWRLREVKPNLIPKMHQLISIPANKLTQ